MSHLAAALLMAAASAAPQMVLIGTWAEEGPPTVLRFERCGRAICASVVGSQFINADPDARDVHNPDPRLRARKLLGMRVVHDLRPARGGWAGRIYIPSQGKFWPLRVEPATGGALTLVICPPKEACSRPKFNRTSA